MQPGQQQWLTENMSFSVSWGTGPSVDRAMRTGGWVRGESRHKLFHGCQNHFGPKALLSACLWNCVRPPAVSRALAAAFCPVGRKSLPTELEAIMPKREETARRTQMACIRPLLLVFIAFLKVHDIVFCGALKWQRHACSCKPTGAHHPAIGHQFGEPDKN